MSELRRELTTGGLAVIAIGACIGSGIFVTPASTLKYLPHHGYALLAWLIGGIVTYFGALTFSEISAKFPKEGGVYQILKNAYGDLIGFLYGWIILLIVNTGALAALGLALADYINFFIPMSKGDSSFFAMGVIWLLTFINIFGVRISQYFAKLFTGLKLLAILGIIAVGLWFWPTSPNPLQFNLTENVPDRLFSGMFLAFVGVFWSMGGWHHATYLAGEAIEPQRTVPRAMLIATIVVTVVYMAVILAYMILLPSEMMMNSTRVAGDALNMVIPNGAKMVTIAITISIFGTIAIYTMTAPRIYYAMAKDKIFFSFLADISPRYGTPYKAMIFQSAWATLLIFIWGSFIKMITFVTFMDILFMALATSTVFVFRRREGKTSGFKMPWYPIPPLIYLVVTGAFVLFTLADLNLESWIGFLILIAGIPVFYWFKKKVN